MRLPSASQHSFAMLPSANIPRSVFDRSFNRKQTFDADYLVPIFLDEVLPGDTFNLNLTTFARMTTPIVPIMDNIYMDYFFFFVPNRLVWKNWQKFNGEQENPGDSTNYIIPQHRDSVDYDVVSNSLQNYMGLTVGTIPYDISVSALPFRAYNLIWNEWFRSENLQNSVVVNKDDGPDDPTDYVLLKRGKRHDYFTSALPFPQKGPAVPLPIGTTAPLYLDAPVVPSWTYRTPTFDESGNAIIGTTALSVNPDSHLQASSGSWPLVNPDVTQYTKVNLSQAAGATINQLREAFQIQKLFERDARGGTRYTEILRSHFGVISPDARLQRPEYLGGGSVPVNINPIAQTSATVEDMTPQGNLAAFATATGRNIGFQKSFVEHGYIIGMVAARADLTYQTGMNKLWMRRTRYDFYWPAFAHLGEQPVLTSELYYNAASGGDAYPYVFGYQERYAEYRYKPSEILGDFSARSNKGLDHWHLAQDFSAPPVLNSSFIESDTPMDRILAVPSEPAFYWDGFYKMICARPMPTYSIPGQIDRF